MENIRRPMSVDESVALGGITHLRSKDSPWVIDDASNERWKVLAALMEDVGPRPSSLGPLAAMLGPIDPLKPIATGNIQWMNDIQHNRLNKVRRQRAQQKAKSDARSLQRKEVLSFREIKWAMVSPSDKLLMAVGRAALDATVAYMEEEKAELRKEVGKSTTLKARAHRSDYPSLYAWWWRTMGTNQALLCERWRVFAAFYEDIQAIGQKPHRARLQRLDPTRPLGAGNARWTS